MSEKKMKSKKTYLIDNNNSRKEKIKSVEGYDCIGPCYPSNTYYYNPLNLSLISNNYPSCPIKELNVIGPDGKIYKKKSDKCYDNDINKGSVYFDIFSDHIQIANTSDDFLTNIYNLNGISDVVYFLSNSISNLPIYSQRRLLEAIYSVYYKYIEFPKVLFATKLLYVIENIYKIENMDVNKIQQKLNSTSKSNSQDLYSLFK